MSIFDLDPDEALEFEFDYMDRMNADFERLKERLPTADWETFKDTWIHCHAAYAEELWMHRYANELRSRPGQANKRTTDKQDQEMIDEFYKLTADGMNNAEAYRVLGPKYGIKVRTVRRRIEET